MKKIMMVSIFVGLMLTGASAENTHKDKFGCSENSKNIQELERVIKQGTKVWTADEIKNFEKEVKSAKEARKNHVCGKRN